MVCCGLFRRQFHLAGFAVNAERHTALCIVRPAHTAWMWLCNLSRAVRRGFGRWGADSEAVVQIREIQGMARIRTARRGI